jgi:transposase InsO family protein
MGSKKHRTYTPEYRVEAARLVIDTGSDLPENVVFHADRGVRFTSAQLAEVSRSIGVLRSMGRTGVCWDYPEVFPMLRSWRLAW